LIRLVTTHLTVSAIKAFKMVSWTLSSCGKITKRNRVGKSLRCSSHFTITNFFAAAADVNLMMPLVVVPAEAVAAIEAVVAAVVGAVETISAVPDVTLIVNVSADAGMTMTMVVVVADTAEATAMTATEVTETTARPCRLKEEGMVGQGRTIRHHPALRAIRHQQITRHQAILNRPQSLLYGFMFVSPLI
jgi:hypothetical protein